MSENNSIYYIKQAEERDTERVKKVTEYADSKFIRFSYEIDNNDITYRGIDLVDFEKACLVSRIELLEKLQNGKDKDYDAETILAKFVTILEFKLFDGLYMGDLEDLIEESDVPVC